jgi:hypothetical protein
MVNAMTDYIQPELMILIPVLYLIGMGLKKANAISDRFIPIILGAVGIALTACYELTTGQFNLFAAVTQGVLCAGASTYANQIYKQLVTK